MLALLLLGDACYCGLLTASLWELLVVTSPSFQVASHISNVARSFLP